MKPAPALRVEPFSDGIDEGGEVVARPLLELADALGRRGDSPLSGRPRTSSGTTPNSAQASSAASSTSSQRSSLCSSDQTLAMAGRE